MEVIRIIKNGNDEKDDINGNDENDKKWKWWIF